VPELVPPMARMPRDTQCTSSNTVYASV
jgi:hypothetical protein